MRNKLLNFFLSIIVILIVVIFSIVYYYMYNNKAEISVYNELYTKEDATIRDEVIEEKDNFEDIEVLNIASSKIQKIFPFTGAFPNINIIPFVQEDIGTVQELSNEQILRLGWSKVTKQDWAESYTGEGNPVSIKAELLDKYIKDIFGNIEYEKQDFSNNKYLVNPYEGLTAHTSSYEVKYDAETDTYVASHTPGDGIDESRIEFPSITAIQYEDEIKIDVKTVISVPEEVQGKDETTGQDIYYLNFKVYDTYNPVTKTLGNELMQYDNRNIYSEEDIVKQYKDLDLSKLNTLSFIYKLNSDTGEYNLIEIKK